MENNEVWLPVSMFCPNCGHKLTGYKRGDGSTKFKCSRCIITVFSKMMKAKTLIEVFPPKER